MSVYLDALALLLDSAQTVRPVPPVDAGGRLVIGQATRYAPDDVRPFVLSLRRHTDAPCLLLVLREAKALHAFLAENAIDVLCVEDIDAPLEGSREFQRFGAFAWHLRRRASLPETVLMVDVRDVIFQADPWPALTGRTVSFYPESDTAALGAHVTSRWIARTFGTPIAQVLAERKCVCAGTIAGRGDRILELLLIAITLAAIPRLSVARQYGIDQAILNYIAHLGLVAGSEVRPNFREVATLGLTPRERLSIADGDIVNPDGSISAIVHQYDRFADLWQAVAARYEVNEAAMTTRHSGQMSVPLAALGKRVRRLGFSLRKRIPEFR